MTNGLFTPYKGKKKGFQISVDLMDKVDRYAELTNRNRTGAGETLLKLQLGMIRMPDGHLEAMDTMHQETLDKEIKEVHQKIEKSQHKQPQNE